MIKKKKKKRKGWADHLLTSQLTLIEKIVPDKQMQQRVSEDKEALEEYKRVLADGGELPAVKCVRDKETEELWLWDGFHTLEAAKQAGLSEIRVEISDGTRRDAWLKSLGANETHGIRRSKADRQKAVDGALNDSAIKLSLLEDDGAHSFRSIAKLCAVGHPTVSRRWNNIHIPKILREINEAVKQGSMPAHQNNKEWFAQIGRVLSVPAWLVEKQYAQHQASLAAQEETSENNLTSGTCTTHQTESAQIIGQEEEETSEADLTGGTRSTRQIGNARDVEPSAEIISTPQPTQRIVTWPSTVIIHDPTREQSHDGDQLSTLLANYASQQCGVQVVEAQRSSDGWTKEANKGINQALSQVTNQGLENVKSILIMIVKD